MDSGELSLLLGVGIGVSTDSGVTGLAATGDGIACGEGAAAVVGSDGTAVVGPGRCCMESLEITGIYFLKNFLFLRVTRPDPSTLTTY